ITRAQRGDLGQGTSVLEDRGTAGGGRLGTNPFGQPPLLGVGIDCQRSPGRATQGGAAARTIPAGRGGVDLGGAARALVIVGVGVARVVVPPGRRVAGLVRGLVRRLTVVGTVVTVLGVPVVVRTVVVVAGSAVGVVTRPAPAAILDPAGGAIVDVVVFVILERNHAEVRLELVQCAHDCTSLSLGSVTTTLVAAPTTRSLRSLILVDLPSAPVAAGC